MMRLARASRWIGPSYTGISPSALNGLASLAKASGWSVLYSENLGNYNGPCRDRRREGRRHRARVPVSPQLPAATSLTGSSRTAGARRPTPRLITCRKPIRAWPPFAPGHRTRPSKAPTSPERRNGWRPTPRRSPGGSPTSGSTSTPRAARAITRGRRPCKLTRDCCRHRLGPRKSPSSRGRRRTRRSRKRDS